MRFVNIETRTFDDLKYTRPKPTDKNTLRQWYTKYYGVVPYGYKKRPFITPGKPPIYAHHLEQPRHTAFSDDVCQCASCRTAEDERAAQTNGHDPLVDIAKMATDEARGYFFAKRAEERAAQKAAHDRKNEQAALEQEGWPLADYRYTELPTRADIQQTFTHEDGPREEEQADPPSPKMVAPPIDWSKPIEYLALNGTWITVELVGRMYSQPTDIYVVAYRPDVRPKGFNYIGFTADGRFHETTPYNSADVRIRNVIEKPKADPFIRYLPVFQRTNGQKFLGFFAHVTRESALKAPGAVDAILITYDPSTSESR